MLVPISPIGIGTPECESLSSFVQRLAAAHGTLPGQLVFRLLTWLDLGRPEMIGQWQRRPGRVRIGKNINSFAHADVWLKVLQQATSRADLGFLTTRHWDHLFPTRGFQRAHLAWCPECLAEDKVPYHRLAWMLQPVRFCAIHHVSLTTICGRCQNLLPVVHERSAITMCPICGADLRISVGVGSAQVVGDYDLWLTTDVQWMIRLSANWHRTLEWNPVSALKVLCRLKGLGDAAALARLIGTSKLTTWYWLTGKARPSLPMALHAYHCFGVSLAKDIESAKNGPVRAGAWQPIFHLRPVRKYRRHDWNRIEQQLLTELKHKKMKARTVTDIARSLEMDTRTLREHLPVLCLKFARNHKVAARAEAKQRQLCLQKQITNSIHQLANVGEKINPKAVAMHLGRPGLFCRHNARRAYQIAVSKSYESQHEAIRS